MAFIEIVRIDRIYLRLPMSLHESDFYKPDPDGYYDFLMPDLILFAVCFVPYVWLDSDFLLSMPLTDGFTLLGRRCIG